MTQSEMDVRGRWFGCIGHEEVSHIDSVIGHWVKMWSADSSWSWHKWQVVSIAGIRAAKVAFVGRISQAIFHKSILWRGQILAFQRMFQSDLARGPDKLNLSFWSVRYADFTEWIPLLLGTQHNLSSWLVGERWMLRILEAVIRSKKVEILPLSHWKVSGTMSSTTLWMVGWIVDEGDGMKFSRVGIQGVSQIGVCWPSPIFMHNPLLRRALDF